MYKYNYPLLCAVKVKFIKEKHINDFLKKGLLHI